MYSAAEFVEMIIIYGECGRNAHEAAREYHERFPERDQYPDHKTILRVISRTQQTGQVQPNRKEGGGAPRLARTVAIEEAVLDAVAEDPTTSRRRIARNVGTSERTIGRILKEHRMHPFHYTRVQHLKPEDYPLRVEFCQWILTENEADPNFLSRIIFSDESSFGREGCFNHHNLHIWAEENPHAFFPRAFQDRFSVNLWAGLLGDHMVGPFELPRRLDGDRYAHFIDRELPELLEDIPLQNIANGWFQHDGAPPHFSRNVRALLDERYPLQWIGRGGPINWPRRSPDLTPLDYFLWGHLKNFIYRTPVESEADLRIRIQEAVASVTPQMIANARTSLIRRARLCIEMNGAHFQHLL